MGQAPRPRHRRYAAKPRPQEPANGSRDDPAKALELGKHGKFDGQLGVPRSFGLVRLRHGDHAACLSNVREPGKRIGLAHVIEGEPPDFRASGLE
jgi:hypothetical protein